jgi:hypothetical protein
MMRTQQEQNIESRMLPGDLRILDYRSTELERAWAELRKRRGLDDGYTERCLVTGEDWEYMGTCIPADNPSPFYKSAVRLIVHTFRHRCATSSRNGARDFQRGHSFHADRSIYMNIVASASYTREVRSGK